MGEGCEGTTRKHAGIRCAGREDRGQRPVRIEGDAQAPAGRGYDSTSPKPNVEMLTRPGKNERLQERQKEETSLAPETSGGSPHSRPVAGRNWMQARATRFGGGQAEDPDAKRKGLRHAKPGERRRIRCCAEKSAHEAAPEATI